MKLKAAELETALSSLVYQATKKEERTDERPSCFLSSSFPLSLSQVEEEKTPPLSCAHGKKKKKKGKGES